jgi:Flp pilus assembly protein CpaB
VENITSSKIFTTRQGTVLLGVIAAVLAAVVIIVYLNHYKDSLKATTEQVLVAKKLIPQGTTGSHVASTGGYEIATKLKSDVLAGAYIDPSSLAGKVALSDITPGQQLTATDFGAAPSGLTGELGKGQRAVVVPLDSPGEVGGQIAAGDHVDVWVLFGSSTVREVLQDMFVMNTSGGNVTLRATPRQAGELIYASANARIWLALRPSLATSSRPPVITANTLGG